jgi:hypothetical protein
MKLVRSALAVAAVSVSAAAVDPAAARAQDQPAGPAKSDGAAPAAPAEKKTDEAKPAPAKKERKVDPKAVEALESFAKRMHSPRSMGLKSLSARGEVETQMFPDPIVFRTTWAADRPLDIDVEVPAALLEAFPPEMHDSIRGLAKQQVLMVVRPLFGGAAEGLDAYDIAWKPADGGGGKASMKPFAEDAPMDSMSWEIGKDGLATRWVFAPHVDPSNPMAAQMAGMEYEVEMKYEARGERHVFSSLTLRDPMSGDTPIQPSYYEVAKGFLPKALEIRGANGSQTVRFFDYVADGATPVEGTARPAAPEKKPADPKPSTPTPAPAPAAPETPAPPK